MSQLCLNSFGTALHVAACWRPFDTLAIKTSLAHMNGKRHCGCLALLQLASELFFVCAQGGGGGLWEARGGRRVWRGDGDLREDRLAAARGRAPPAPRAEVLRRHGDCFLPCVPAPIRPWEVTYHAMPLLAPSDSERGLGGQVCRKPEVTRGLGSATPVSGTNAWPLCPQVLARWRCAPGILLASQHCCLEV